LGIWKIRLEETLAGEIPSRNIAKPRQPKYAGGGGKPGADRDRHDFSTS
jgi:hypothetical protein